MSTAIVNTNVDLFSPTEAQKFDIIARGLAGLQKQLDALVVAGPADAADVQRILAARACEFLDCLARFCGR